MPNYPEGADNKFAPWNRMDPTDKELRDAEAHLFSDPSVLQDIFVDLSNIKEPSRSLGEISNVELVGMLFELNADDKVKKARIELRNRIRSSDWFQGLVYKFIEESK
jgi:hypothetical protein